MMPGDAAAQVRGDTTADCGRFFLKYNPETKRRECVGGRRSNANPDQQIRQLTQQLTQTVRLLQRALDGAEAILRTRQLNQETERRVRDLLNDASNARVKRSSLGARLDKHKEPAVRNCRLSNAN